MSLLQFLILTPIHILSLLQLLGHSLILTWIPNTSLKKNPRSLQNSPLHPVASPRKSPRQEFAKTSWSPAQSPLANGNQHHRGDSGQETSPSGSSSGDAPKLSTSLKSQTDSGIGNEDIVDSKHEDVVNNGENNGKSITREPLSHCSIDSPSSESEIGAPSSEQQLQCLLQHKKVTDLKEAAVAAPETRQGADEERKPRTSSNRSVTSIEMEGDNLVVVTEEIDDSTFLEENEMEAKNSSSSSISGGDGPPMKVTKQPSDACAVNGDDTSAESLSLSSDSTYPSPTGEHYHHMLEELSGERCGPGARDPDMDKLKDTLQLDLAGDTSPTHCMDSCDDDSSACSISSGSSVTTSGPDTSPPTPLTPPSPPPLDTTPPYSTDGGSPTVTYNMTFPDNSVSYDQSPCSGHRTAKEQVCGVFSVDLGEYYCSNLLG